MNVSVATILLTRPEAAAARFALALRAADVRNEVMISPLLEVVPETVEINWSAVDGVIFSSQNGVASVAGRNLVAWCVGAATTQAAAAKGWQAVDAGGDAEALYRRVLADAPAGQLLHLRGQHARGDLAKRLAVSNVKAREIVVYRQELRRLSADANRLLARGNPIIVPLFSPRTAAQFARFGPFAAQLTVVAMSAAVAQAVEMLPTERVVIAARPDAVAMADAVARLLDAGGGIETGVDLA